MPFWLRAGRLVNWDAAGAGADGILFTCPAFGLCIEAVASEYTIPVLKPNEAMIDEAARAGRRIGLVPTFAPTLASMPAEFPADIDVVPKPAQGALAELDRGNAAEHDRLIVQAAMELRACDIIAPAQYSMALAAEAVS